MVFNLNKWSEKAKNTENSHEREMYFQKRKEAINGLINEYVNVFKPRYYDSKYNCHINETYLEQVVLPEILDGNVFIPPTFWSYINKHYNIYHDKLMELREIQHNNGMFSSVYGGGLKMIEAGLPYLSTESLMFEVWEFTLTYPEFKDLFVEEWN